MQATDSDDTPKATPAIAYSSRALRRAERAFRCSPLRLKLLVDLRHHSIALQAMVDSRGIHNGYTRRPLSELGVEGELLWLITVGLLRREVDGQGITDSFRLTPLGRQLLQHWELAKHPDLTPRVQDHLYNAVSRWLRLPGWLSV
ncbi:hypothetical protein XM38_020210 [Halomicronema hongdechloris C2206]|uniref:Uncharacterized protein n=1 Tax=Halomicronema hongdechloris C2206 TaxID=1641165 RepID=A0A1Z3HL87_9CYAN|nr:Npun_F0494 family protein [Halomicronema hongdechloris]ASC71071.1 hypothetical protein XM38_020210 [Halomicronema hongdechloris C2206]